MKKIFSFALAALSIAFLLIACEKTEYPTFEEKGLEIIGIMEDMINSEKYLEIYGVRDEALEIIESTAEGDYSEAEHIYEVKLQNFYGDLIDDYDELPKSLRKVAEGELGSTFVSRLNVTAGIGYMTAAYSITAEVLFNTDVEDSTVYIYTFEDGVPIAVSFSVNDEGICSAYGMFLFTYNDLDLSSARTLEKSLDFYDCDVEKIK